MGGIGHIGGEFPSLVEEPVMLGAMRREAEMQIVSLRRRLHRPQYVAFGAHLTHAEIGQAGAIHRETVMMLGHRHHIAGARSAEQ